MEEEQLKKVVLKKDVAVKAMSTRDLDMEIKAVIIKTEKVLQSKPNAVLLLSAKRKGAKSTRTRDGFIETIPPIYPEFSLHVEKAVVSHCCKEVS